MTLSASLSLRVPGSSAVREMGEHTSFLRTGGERACEVIHRICDKIVCE